MSDEITELRLEDTCGKEVDSSGQKLHVPIYINVSILSTKKIAGVRTTRSEFVPPGQFCPQGRSDSA